jgi:alginate O-acetyltransferase complex protein AlgJ
MDSVQQGSSPDLALEVKVERTDESAPALRADLRTDVTAHGLAIFGWAIGREQPAEEVEIFAEGELLTRVPIDVERPDVVEALDLGAEATPGFYSLLEPEGVGASQLCVYVLLAGEERILLGQLEVGARSGESNAGDGSQQLTWTVRLPPPEREKVLIGKDGWLYLVRDSNDVIGQQTGRVHLSEQARQEWRRVLLRRSEATERVGTRWFTVVVPDKEIVYPEYLPDEIVPAAGRPVHEILDIAASVGAPVTYALPLLQEAKKSFSLYPRTDSHWSYRGSYVVYRLLCELVEESGYPVPVLGEDEIEWSEPVVPGGLGGKMHPPQTSPLAWARLPAHSSRLIFDNQIINHGRVVVFEQEAAGDATCVLFGESFAQHLVLFLKESFRRLVYVHTSMLVDEIIEIEQPEVVVNLPVERFLIKVPDDTPGLAGLSASAAQKAERGTLGSEMAFVSAVPRASGASAADQVGRMPWPDRR